MIKIWYYKNKYNINDSILALTLKVAFIKNPSITEITKVKIVNVKNKAKEKIETDKKLANTKAAKEDTQKQIENAQTKISNWNNTFIVEDTKTSTNKFTSFESFRDKVKDKDVFDIE